MSTTIRIRAPIGTLHNALFWCLENLENKDWCTIQNNKYERSLIGRTAKKWKEWEAKKPFDNKDEATGVFVFSERITKDSLFTEFVLKFV